MPSSSIRRRRKASLGIALLIPGLANAALMHRPISNHPIDLYATPRVDIKYLNSFPITRTEAHAWKKLIADNGLQDPQAESQAVVRYYVEAEEVDVAMLGDVFVGTRARDPWDATSQSFTWRIRPVTATTASNSEASKDAYPRLLQLRLPSRMDAAEEIEDWLCMLPSLASLEPKTIVNDSASVKQAVAPVDAEACMHSLDHLNGKCLYHRAGWFTYA